MFRPLLRVIQEREVVRLGTHARFRLMCVCCSAQPNLMEMVDESGVPVDLYYRCHVIELARPGDRPDDTGAEVVDRL